MLALAPQVENGETRASRAKGGPFSPMAPFGHLLVFCIVLYAVWGMIGM